MPIQPTYPGVYIQEISSGVHTITGVSTSVTAFIGNALRGPTSDQQPQPITINSFADFQRIFGGLWVNSTLGYAVNDFFVNGGSQAILVRVTDGKAQSALSSQPAHSPVSLGLNLVAKNPGKLGNNIDCTITSGITPNTFNILIEDTSTSPVSPPESYDSLTLATIGSSLSGSKLVTLNSIPTAIPTITVDPISLQGGTSTFAKSFNLGLNLVAQQPGTAGNNITCTIANSNASADTFDLNIIDTNTHPSGPPESFPGLTLTSILNTLSRSQLVTLLGNIPPTTLPANTNQPIFLEGGTDSSAHSVNLDLNLAAKQTGTAGNKIQCVIANSNTTAGTFDLTITDTNTTPSGPPESHISLTLATINTSLNTSKLVTLNSVPTAIPANTINPIFLQGGTSSTPAYSPNLALDLTAQQTGIVGNNISCAIANINAAAGTFDLTITNNNANPPTTEPYPGLTLATISTSLSTSKLVILNNIPTAIPPITSNPAFLQGGGGATQAYSPSLALDLSAQQPGIEGNNISCTIANSTATTFDLIIMNNNVVEESHTGLTLTSIGNALNGSLVKLNSMPTAIPANTLNPIFLQGGASTQAYSPNLNLNLVAQQSGSWGNNIVCSIANSNPATGTFDLTIINNNANPPVQETYTSLTLGSVASQLNSSKLVNLINTSTTMVLPTNTIVPLPLTGGLGASNSTDNYPYATSVTAANPNPNLFLTAKKPGTWGNNISYAVTTNPNNNAIYDLTVTDNNIPALPKEIYYGVTTDNISTQLSTSQLVSLVNKPTTISASPSTNLQGGNDGSLFIAANPGSWSNNLEASVTYSDPQDVQDIANQYGLNPTDLFNLTITDTGTGATEQFSNVTVVTNPPTPAQLDQVLLNQSQLLRVNGQLPKDRPPNTIYLFVQGTDSGNLSDQNILGNQAQKTGLYALENISIFNLLCIPGYIIGYNNTYDIGNTVLTNAVAYCVQRKAFFVIDAPSTWTSKDLAKSGVKSLISAIGSANSSYCAVYFPRIQEPDLLSNNQLKTYGPCGMIAGVMANIDGQRGIWKAPAGLEAGLAGVSQLTVPLTDAENGELNPIAVNCLRTFPASGSVIWGARTLQGNDLLSSDWKYVPVRRFALYLEQSIYSGIQWAVFEPNDAPLWRQLTLTISSFMNTLFRQGAFQGQTTQQAYFVKCDNETTTQDDINNGIVNVQVGFAPLKPAEFVVISIQQIAGQN